MELCTHFFVSGFHLAALYLWDLFMCSTGLFLYLCVLSHCMNIPRLSIPLLIFLPLFFSLKVFLSWLSFLFPPCFLGTGRLTPCDWPPKARFNPFSITTTFSRSKQQRPKSWICSGNRLLSWLLSCSCGRLSMSTSWDRKMTSTPSFRWHLWP